MARWTDGDLFVRGFNPDQIAVARWEGGLAGGLLFSAAGIVTVGAAEAYERRR